MEKLFLTVSQDESLKKLKQIGLKEGRSENEVKGRILETHIQNGWENTPAKSLSSLSADEMGRALFATYEIKEEILKYQEYLVSFILNKHTTIETKVIKHDAVLMREEEIVQLAIKYIGKLNIEVNNGKLNKIKTIKQEKSIK